MISSRRYNPAWNDCPTFFKALDTYAIQHELCRADSSLEISRGLEVYGPFMWFVVRVGPKGDPGCPARVFVLSDLEQVLGFRIPKDTELRGIDLVAGSRSEFGCTAGMCLTRVWRRKKFHPGALSHLLETADGGLIPVPYADLRGLDVADFEAVLSLPPPVELEERAMTRPAERMRSAGTSLARPARTLAQVIEKLPFRATGGNPRLVVGTLPDDNLRALVIPGITDEPTKAKTPHQQDGAA